MAAINEHCEPDALRPAKAEQRINGSAHGAEVTFAEAFELSEFGSQPGEEELRTLFPRQNPGED